MSSWEIDVCSNEDEHGVHYVLNQIHFSPSSYPYNVKTALFFFPVGAAVSKTDSFNISEVITQDSISILLDCLSDSYEMNKMMAFDLLMATPPEQLPFQVCVA